MAELAFVRYEKRERVAYVTINRPEVLNALHPPAKKELAEVWNDYSSDPELWVAILTGAGDRAFCAGDDLKYRAAQPEERQRSVKHGLHPLDKVDKPVIAAVNGYAVGGGLELALRCDIIIAADSARFGLPEPRRGLLADDGGVVMLPRHIPYHLAMGLVLTGKLIDAQEAYRLGLVNEVVPLPQLMSTAERWATAILECAPLAVQAAKQAIRSTMHLPSAAAKEAFDALPAVRRLRASEDYIEGPRAFAEKRHPCWKGR